jgi:hypothetical protein
MESYGLLVAALYDFLSLDLKYVLSLKHGGLGSDAEY